MRSVFPTVKNATVTCVIAVQRVVIAVLTVGGGYAVGV